MTLEKTSKQPHFAVLLATAVLASITIAVIETTSASEWIAESGFIHLVAVTFVTVAIIMAVRLRRMVVGEFRPLLGKLVAGLAILGTAHIVEYFIDARGIIDERFAPAIIASFYAVAFAVLSVGAIMLLHAAGEKSGAAKSVALGIVLPTTLAAALMWLLRIPRDGFAFLSVTSLVLLVSAAILAFRSFRHLMGRMTVVAPLSRYVLVALLAVLVAGFVEPLTSFVSPFLPLHEWVFENLAHYPFYIGLLALCFGFDFANHFGGIYAEMRAESQ